MTAQALTSPSYSPARFNFAQSMGRMDEKIELTGLFRPGLRAITSSGDEAVLLQQLIYLTQRQGREWIEGAASYVGDPLGIPRRTAHDCLVRLERRGFIATESPGAGLSKHHKVLHQPILAALHKAGYATTLAALCGETQAAQHAEQEGGGFRQGGVRNPPGGGWRNPPQEELPPKEEYKKSVTEGGRGEMQDAKDTLDYPKDTLSHLSTLIKPVFPTASSQDITAVGRKLKALGFSQELALAYVIERMDDFAQRRSTPAWTKARRYMLNPQDMLERGYRLTRGMVLLEHPQHPQASPSTHSQLPPQSAPAQPSPKPPANPAPKPSPKPRPQDARWKQALERMRECMSSQNFQRYFQPIQARRCPATGVLELTAHDPYILAYLEHQYTPLLQETLGQMGESYRLGPLE